MGNLGIDIVPLIAATVAYMVIGMLWYSPTLFGAMWMKGMGWKKKDMEKAKKKGMAKPMMGTIAVALIMGYVLQLFYGWLQVSDVMGAITVSLWLWLGFVATTGFSLVLWEQRNLNVYIINAANFLVTLVVMGTILVSL